MPTTPPPRIIPSTPWVLDMLRLGVDEFHRGEWEEVTFPAFHHQGYTPIYVVGNGTSPLPLCACSFPEKGRSAGLFGPLILLLSLFNPGLQLAIGVHRDASQRIYDFITQHNILTRTGHSRTPSNAHHFPTTW